MKWALCFPAETKGLFACTFVRREEEWYETHDVFPVLFGARHRTCRLRWHQSNRPTSRTSAANRSEQPRRSAAICGIERKGDPLSDHDKRCNRSRDYV